MSVALYPKPTRTFTEKRRRFAPEQEAVFRQFSKAVFADGASSRKAKQVIAIAAAHVTQCPYCIEGHTEAATAQGATPEEVMEAIWVAAEMLAGAAYAHATLTLAVLEHQSS